jgi:hypothetical protein
MAEMGTKVSDNSLRKPAYREIFVGSEVDVINREGVLQGRGKLIKRCPSRTTTDNLPYVKNELDSTDNKKREEYSHIWSYERWTVEWVRHPFYRPGERSCVEVNYYIHTRINHDSKYDIHFPTQDTSNKYIFVEEEGVLITPRQEYPKPAVKALNKVHKVFGGDIVMYSYQQDDTRAKCEKHGVYPRILTFLNTSVTFEEAVAEYVETVDSKDFMILAGKSKIRHNRVIHIDMTKGICLKKEVDTKKPKTA